MEQWSRRNNAIRRIARTPRADLALRFFDIRQATGIDDSVWEPFQVETFNRTAMLVSINKSRQIGMSFTIAGDELCDGMIKNDHTVVMLSFNLEEAREKIIYAKKWWEARNPDPSSVPLAEEFDTNGVWRGPSPRRIQRWPELVRDNSLELAWDSGFRMISHPCRPPRGKKASVVLDEFAHYMGDGPIFTAALPMLTRGRGRNRLTIISTPLGAGNKYWEIHVNDGNKYPNYVRLDYGWWENSNLCLGENRLACLADFLAGNSQAVLVRKYGTEMARFLHSNQDPDDFAQEYGLQFLDAKHAFFSLDLIRGCDPDYWIDRDAGLDEDFEEGDWLERYRHAYFGVKARAEKDRAGVTSIDSCLKAIEELAEAVHEGLVVHPLCLSYDVGRENDPSELQIWEAHPERANQRALITMPQVEYDLQMVVLCKAYDEIPAIRTGMIDKGGIGSQLSEQMAKRYGHQRACPVQFDNAKKERWALGAKRSMERRAVTLIPDRDQVSQFHAIRRRASSAKNMIYELETTTSSVGGGQKVKHHGDKFWTAAMGIYLCDKFNGVSALPMIPEGHERDVHQDTRLAPGNRSRRSVERSGASNVRDILSSKTGGRR